MTYTENTFKGGIAEGSKVGYEGSFQDANCIDYKTDTDRITLNKKLKKISGSTVTDWVKWFLEYNSDIWGYGDSGNIYKIDSSNNFTNPKTVSNSVGNGIGTFNDELWYAGNSSLGRTLNLASGSPTFIDDYFKSSLENRILRVVTSGSTYTTATTIVESATTKYTFTAPSTAPIIMGVQLYIVTKGTGTVKVTLHDNSNLLIAEATLATGSITANKFHYFLFPATRLVASASYHIHVTSTVADTTIQTSTLNDLSTVHITINKSYNDLDRDQSRIPTSSTKLEDITVPTTLDETSTNYITFVPTYRELSAVTFWVVSSSAATWTITIHDSEHNIIGSVATTTIYSRSLTRFEFATPLSVIPGETYHIHITSSASNTIFSSSTTLSTGAYFITHFNILQSNAIHKMVEFGNLLCIASGRYLLTIDDSEVIDPHALVLPKGEVIRDLEVVGDQLMITPQRGSNIGDSAQGYLYIWDGDSPFYTGSLPVNGQVQAMQHDNNTLLFLHGPQIRISRYDGGITPKRRLKNMKRTITANVHPGSISASDGLIYFGLHGASSDDIDSMVYTYGKVDQDYNNTLNKDYIISTGNKNSNVHIGAIKALGGGKLFVAWKDTNTGTVYGVDTIDSVDSASGFITFLRMDGKKPNRLKKASAVSILFMPLADGQKITVNARINQKGNFDEIGVIDGTTVSNQGSVYRSFSFDERFFEIEFQVKLETTTGVAPQLLSLEMEFVVEPQFQIGQL